MFALIVGALFNARPLERRPFERALLNGAIFTAPLLKNTPITNRGSDLLKTPAYQQQLRAPLCPVGLVGLCSQ